MHYVTSSRSCLPHSELEGTPWQESGPAGKTFQYVSVNYFSSLFHLAEYTVHHVCDPLQCFVVVSSLSMKQFSSTLRFL
jgi:hypothetical protein